MNQSNTPEEVMRPLSQSANDFKNLVWPKIKEAGWLQGELEPVELQSTTQWAKQLDVLAGIDAWEIKPQGLVGIASRVQWRPAKDNNYSNSQYPYNTINIRKQTKGGGLTELAKRTIALTSGGELIYPFWTCHAYLEQPTSGPVLSVGLIKTQDIIEAISLGFGFDKKNPEDGNIFRCVPFLILHSQGYHIYTYPKINQQAFKEI